MARQLHLTGGKVGPSRVGRSPRSNGIRESFILGSASSAAVARQCVSANARGRNPLSDRWCRTCGYELPRDAVITEDRYSVCGNMGAAISATATRSQKLAGMARPRGAGHRLRRYLVFSAAVGRYRRRCVVRADRPCFRVRPIFGSCRIRLRLRTRSLCLAEGPM